MKSIKKTLQSESWDRFLRQEAQEGNSDAIEILKWRKKNRWLKSQKHLPPRGFDGLTPTDAVRLSNPCPFLQGKPKVEV